MTRSTLLALAERVFRHGFSDGWRSNQTGRQSEPLAASGAWHFYVADGALQKSIEATPPTPAAEEREAVALAMLNGKRLREGWPITASIPEGFADGDEWRLEAQDALSALAPIRAAEILAARTSGRNDATKAYLEGVEHGEAAGEANERARIVAWVDQHKAETCPGHCPDKQGIDLVNHGYGNALVNCRAAIERNTAALTANHSATVVEE